MNEGAERVDAIISVAGEVDFVNAPRWREELVRMIESGPRTLTVDLAGLRFIDSSGLSVLIVAWQAAARCGVELALSSVPPFFRQILDITGLVAVLPIRDIAPGTPDRILREDAVVGDP